MKKYTDEELLDRVKSLDSFKELPSTHWLLGVQSLEDKVNCFDDKFYLFEGGKFIKHFTGTTNSGITGLKDYEKYNKKGVAVVKTNEWYYDLWKLGLHKGRMQALRQVKAIKYYRDGNKDESVDETGKVHEGIIGINFHTASYSSDLSITKEAINGWSVGCQVANSLDDYYEVLEKVSKQDFVSYCLLKEF